MFITTTPANRKEQTHIKDNFLIVHLKKAESCSDAQSVQRSSSQCDEKKTKKSKQTDRQLAMAAGSKNYRAASVDIRTDVSDIKRGYEFALAHPSAERLCPFHLRVRCRSLGCICFFEIPLWDSCPEPSSACNATQNAFSRAPRWRNCQFGNI